MTTRRGFVAGTMALVASPAFAEPYGAIPPLKSVSPYPLGVAVKVSQLANPAWTGLAASHVSRLTPEWEMKMEYVLQDDGSLRLDRGDQIAAFARQSGLGLHGHALIWYAEDGAYFQRLQGNSDAFLNAYAGYIQGVMGHYRGRVTGWDVVNEPVRNDGSGLRDCLWRKVLGDDYIGLALTAAHEADPQAVLFLNDYNLESTPKKRATFLRLCETLLRNGAPLHGIGTQTHISADIAPGAIRSAIRDIASLGLKVHVSEVDISLREERPANMAQPRLDQIRCLRELAAAYHDVPESQRYGMTFWGLRDNDSWLNAPKNGLLPDEPLLFDAKGRPKPLARAFASSFTGTPL